MCTVKISVVMTASKLPLLFVLAIALSPAIGYICSNKNSPVDDFEAHGCFCGTETVGDQNNPANVFFKYPRAFEGCHEANNADVTIECAFLDGDAGILKDRFNRTSLSEIPVVDENQREVYENVTCL